MAGTDVERFIEIQDESNHYDIASPIECFGQT